MSAAELARKITVGARGFSKVIENSINTLRDALGVLEEEAAEGCIPAEHFKENIDAFVASTRSPYLKQDYANAVDLDACIPYSGKLTLDGYAPHNPRKIAFEYFKGSSIEEGNELDHACCVPGQCKGGPTCPHRACVNASHFHEMRAEHNVRLNGNNKGQSMNKPAPVRIIGGECKKGHEMTEENVREDGKCRACNNAQQERWRNKRRHKKFMADHAQGFDFSDWEMFENV